MKMGGKYRTEKKKRNIYRCEKLDKKKKSYSHEPLLIFRKNIFITNLSSQYFIFSKSICPGSYISTFYYLY